MTPWHRFDITLDHFVVAASSLEQGQAWFGERLGVPLQAGGQHKGIGTHNMLLQLGGGTYLEVIAPDPSQPEPTRVDENGNTVRRARPFNLDNRQMQRAIKTRPRLVHFVMRTRTLDTALAAIDYDCGDILAMQRGDLRWRLAVRNDGGLPQLRSAQNHSKGPSDAKSPTLKAKTRAAESELIGVLPTLIDWGDTPNPGTTLEHRGVSFQALQVAAPAALLVRLGGIARDPRIQLCEAVTPQLSIELQSPQGWVLID